MPRAFIGVGSNINPEDSVRRAIHLLAGKLRIIGISTFYCTKPEARPEQPCFYNGVVEVETDIPPEELKHSVLQRIEDQLGRRRTKDKYAPRTIDLDLLIYGDLVAADDMTIPDPRIPRRPYLAVPLYELAPDLVLPGSGTPIRDAAAAFAKHDMKPLPEYTELLRRDILDRP